MGLKVRGNFQLDFIYWPYCLYSLEYVSWNTWFGEHSRKGWSLILGWNLSKEKFQPGGYSLISTGDITGCILYSLVGICEDSMSLIVVLAALSE